MRIRWWRPLWRLEHDDVVAWAGNDYRRGRFDAWLGVNGLPPGRELAEGTLCAVRDWWGRDWVCARRRADGRLVRGRLRSSPPVRPTPAR